MLAQQSRPLATSANPLDAKRHARGQTQSQGSAQNLPAALVVRTVDDDHDESRLGSNAAFLIAQWLARQDSNLHRLDYQSNALPNRLLAIIFIIFDPTFCLRYSSGLAPKTSASLSSLHAHHLV